MIATYHAYAAEQDRVPGMDVARPLEVVLGQPQLAHSHIASP